MGGVWMRARQTSREAFEAEASVQEAQRPATRPRPPPVADDKHSAPLWCQHLQTYVSYSWRERDWKRWSMTAKIWKTLPDIDAVVRGESQIHMAAVVAKEGQKWATKIPSQSAPAGYGEPLWYQAEWLWVSYNSTSGDWMEWYNGAWVTSRTADWPEMPVVKKTTEKRDSNSLDIGMAKSQESQSEASSESSSAPVVVAVAVAEQNQKPGEVRHDVKNKLTKLLGYRRRNVLRSSVNKLDWPVTESVGLGSDSSLM